MEKAIKDKNKLLAVCLTCSILFVLGIPMIIIGAINSLWIILGPGIAFTAINFYAVPIVWTYYPSAVFNCQFVHAIIVEHIRSVPLLALQFSKTEKYTKSTIELCISKGYLIGFLFDGTNIIENTNINNKIKFIPKTCINCGAPYSHPINEQGICPYCGTPSEQ